MYKIFLTVVALYAISAAAHATPFLDTFETDDLSSYTKNVVYRSAANGNTISFLTSGGYVHATRGTYLGTNAEQVTFLRKNSLNVGETLRLDILGTSQSPDFYYNDIGLALSYSDDTTDVAIGSSGDKRTNTLAVYLKMQSCSVGYWGYDGTNGTTPLGASSGITPTEGFSNITGLFIKRSSSTDFILGYKTAAGDAAVKTFTVTNTAIGNAVGFYADLRDLGAFTAPMDNLRIEAVPEPTTIATLAAAACGLALFLRRR